MSSKTYNQLQKELDQLISKLQDDELDIDEAVSTYQAATAIIEDMQKHLKTAKNKLSKVKH